MTGSSVILLLFVLAVLGGTAILLARRRGGVRMSNRDAAMIRLLSSRSIGFQSALHVVEVDGRRFLLSSTRSGIARLGAWSPAQRDGVEGDDA
jgi:flagellar biogenesis protein FliO